MCALFNCFLPYRVLRLYSFVAVTNIPASPGKLKNIYTFCNIFESFFVLLFIMTKKSAVYFYLLFVTLLFLSNSSAGQSNATSKEPSDLYKTIAAMDSIFFTAFNMCDTTKSKSLFTKDLEFYHDAGGLTNYEQNLQSIRYRCSSTNKVRRELVAGSVEVYPIKDYGAIQIGQHRFYYTEVGKEEQLDGTFKFIHIWMYKNKEWKISRVISFDH
jgi:Domain of unknown function (DUF4440)